MVEVKVTTLCLFYGVVSADPNLCLSTSFGKTNCGLPVLEKSRGLLLGG